jgi:RNA recognition motif-containing protein
VAAFSFPVFLKFPEGGKMEPKLYVGNLSYQTTEDELRELFSQAGTVASVDLIKDRDTGSSKGFAFVTMGSASEAENAINLFNGKSLGNRELKVNQARPREERPSGGGFGGGRGAGGGGGGGGYRSDRGGPGGGGGGGGRDRRPSGGGGQRRY